MTVYLTKSDGRIVLTARATGRGGAIGDATFEVKPGETVFGRNYDEWAALPEGAYEVS